MDWQAGRINRAARRERLIRGKVAEREGEEVGHAISHKPLKVGVLLVCVGRGSGAELWANRVAFAASRK